MYWGPHASAKITNINYQKAKEYKGINYNKSSNNKKMHINPMYPGFKVKTRMKGYGRYWNILSDGIVRYVGEPILAIIAETFEIAQEAADFVDIEFKELESTTNLNIAIKHDAPVVREELTNNICFDWELGDKKKTEKAFKGAANITTIKLVNNRLVPNPIECRSAIGQYHTESSTYSLHCSSQGVHSLKKKLSNIFNINENKINVFTPDVGGGFGMKIFNYPEYVLTLAAAKITKKQLNGQQKELFLSDIHGRDHIVMQN